MKLDSCVNNIIVERYVLKKKTCVRLSLPRRLFLFSPNWIEWKKFYFRYFFPIVLFHDIIIIIIASVYNYQILIFLSLFFLHQTGLKIVFGRLSILRLVIESCSLSRLELSLCHVYYYSSRKNFHNIMEFQVL